MKNRTFLAIYITNLSVLWVCSGLLPLLPIYAAELGATPAATGNYLALAFLGTALGTAGAGWVSSRFQRRRALIVVAGLLSAPATWLMGQATAVWQLALWTTVVWLLAGATLTLVSVLAGLAAGPSERGKVFGLLGLTSALASMLGGSMTGPIADRWGYETLLSVMALFWFVQVVGGLLVQERRQRAPETSTTVGSISRPPSVPWPLILLLIANFLLCTARFISGMGQTWAMDAQGFTAAAVTLVAAVGAAGGLVLHPLAGRLSDSLGRQTVLVVTYAGAVLGLAFMAAATSLTHFLLVMLLLTVSYAADAVAPAFVTDLVAREQLDRWMSLFTTTRWIGAIVGYAGAGYAVHFFGLYVTLLASALLPLLGIVLLLQVQRTRGRDAATPPLLGQAPRRAFALK